MHGAPWGSWAQLRQMCSSRCGVSSLWLLLWEIFLGAVAQEPSECVCCCQVRTRTRSGEPQGSGAEGALKTSTEDCQLSLSQSARRLWFSCHWTREPRSLWAAPFPWMFYILCIQIHTWNSSFLPQKNQVVSHKTQVVQAMIMQEILIISAFLLISSWLLQSHEHRCL